MPRQYLSSKSPTSITYWRKFAEHRLIYIFIAALFGLSIVAYFGSSAPGGRGSDAQNAARSAQVVATVNGEDVTRSAYDRQWDRMKQFAASNPSQAVQFQGMLVNSLIDSAILRAAAKARHIAVSDAEVDKAIQDMKKDRTGKAISDDEFQQQLDAQGTSLSDLKDQIRESLYPKLLQDSMASKTPVTEKDLLASYDEYHLSHILISTGKATDAQAKARADKVYQEVKAGKDFAQLANEYSDDPSNKPTRYDPKLKKSVPSGAPKGGDLGWSPLSRYVAEFSAAAKNLKPGEVSPPVKTQFGYHIIKMEGVRQNLPKDYAKNKAKLLDDYRQQQASKAMQDFMTDARKSARIVWKDPSFEWRYLYSQNNPSMMGMSGASGNFMQNQDKLVAKLREAVAKSPDDSTAALVLGQTIYTRYVMAPPGPERDKLRSEVIDAYKTAISKTEDANTRMTLAQLYRDAKQPDQALALYKYQQRLLRWETGSQAKYLHMQLEKAFKDLGEPALAAEETTALKKIAEDEAKAKAKEAADKAEKAKQEAAAKAAAAKTAAKPGDKTAAPTAATPSGGASGAVTVIPSTTAPAAGKPAASTGSPKPDANAGKPKQ